MFTLCVHPSTAPRPVCRSEGVHHLGSQLRHWSVSHVMWWSRLLALQRLAWYLCRVHPHLHLRGREHGHDAADCEVAHHTKMYDHKCNASGGPAEPSDTSTCKKLSCYFFYYVVRFCLQLLLSLYFERKLFCLVPMANGLDTKSQWYLSITFGYGCIWFQWRFTQTVQSSVLRSLTGSVQVPGEKLPSGQEWPAAERDRVISKWLGTSEGPAPDCRFQTHRGWY